VKEEAVTERIIFGIAFLALGVLFFLSQFTLFAGLLPLGGSGLSQGGIVLIPAYLLSQTISLIRLIKHGHKD
jgi:hypothetical protein